MNGLKIIACIILSAIAVQATAKERYWYIRNGHKYWTYSKEKAENGEDYIYGDEPERVHYSFVKSPANGCMKISYVGPGEKSELLPYPPKKPTMVVSNTCDRDIFVMFCVTQGMDKVCGEGINGRSYYTDSLDVPAKDYRTFNVYSPGGSMNSQACFGSYTDLDEGNWKYDRRVDKDVPPAVLCKEKDE